MFVTRTTYIPISDCRSFSLPTHSHFGSTAAAANTPLIYVPSCRPSKMLKLYLPSTLASDRTIVEPYYQTYRTHLALVHTFFGLGLQHPSSSPSVRLFFFVFCHRPTTSFAPQNTTRPEMATATSMPSVQVSFLKNLIVNLTTNVK